MADQNCVVSLNNQTGETLYLCVQYDGKFQEWNIPNNGNLAIDATKYSFIILKSEPGQCPE